jgi:hypothetical protein
VKQQGEGGGFQVYLDLSQRSAWAAEGLDSSWIQSYDFVIYNYNASVVPSTLERSSKEKKMSVFLQISAALAL